MLGANGDFNHVRVLLTHASVNIFEVAGHSAEIVVADNPADITKTPHHTGHVGFEIDPIKAGDDGLAEQGQACLLGAFPGSAIDGAAHGGDERTGLGIEQAFEIRRFGEIVEAYLD